MRNWHGTGGLTTGSGLAAHARHRGRTQGLCKPIKTAINYLLTEGVAAVHELRERLQAPEETPHRLGPQEGLVTEPVRNVHEKFVWNVRQA